MTFRSLIVAAVSSVWNSRNFRMNSANVALTLVYSHTILKLCKLRVVVRQWRVLLPANPGFQLARIRYRKEDDHG